MPKFIYNTPLALINKKPKGEQMTENGYGFYMFPSLVFIYACRALNLRELKLYLAISGQAEKDSLGKPCKWAVKHYCEIANIKSNHYSEVLQGLCEKGFIIHNNFESIEVLYPISENEYLSQNGTIKKGSYFPNKESASRQANSSIGKSANQAKGQVFPQNEEEIKSEKGNFNTNFRNNNSQIKANNKEINNLINNSNKDKEGSKPSQKWEGLEEKEKKQEDFAFSIKDLL